MSTTPWKPASLLTGYSQLLRWPPKRSTAGLLVAAFLALKLRQKLQSRTRAAMSSSPKKAPSIPGFKRLSDQVFVRESDQEGDQHPEHPDVVLIYGWGDGLPKHLAKYADGFRVLFPHSKQVVILSPIAKAMLNNIEQRTESMVPVVKEVCPNGSGGPGAPRSVLVHAMSNTGAINFAATLNAHREMFGTYMRYNMLSLDSSPGSTDYTWSNLMRWSRALALGIAAAVPLPFIVIQAFSFTFFSLHTLYLRLTGQMHAGAWAMKVVKAAMVEDPKPRTLYLYGKADDIIPWQDIEVDVADATGRGWAADVAVFEGTGHVGHMRQHGEKYWNALQTSWGKTVEPLAES